MRTMAGFKPLWILMIYVLQYVCADFQVSDKNLKITLGSQGYFDLSLTRKLKTNVTVTFDIGHKDLVNVIPLTFNVTENDAITNWNITVLARSLGSVTVSANVTPADATEFAEAFVMVTVERSEILDHVSTVVGWIYFLAWSISFYPQIYINYKRKSVVGLNFDFLSLNVVGFTMYALFNCGLYWVPVVEQEYFRRYPKGLNPIQLNDIFFALHAVLATGITISQCFIYETGTQRVSITARAIHGLFSLLTLVSIILSITETITWLDFLYICSYVKLTITLIKYVPQAYYNYERQSTVGWSIQNIFLDFTGGVLSMLQMIINAYNYDDWRSIFGDPTKFGLGLFSVSFDVFFIIQHYVLYRDAGTYAEVPGICRADPEQEETGQNTSSTA